MKVTFRWYGDNDPVTLEKIKQIPGVEGIVTAIYDIPVGEVWPLEKIITLKKTVNTYDFEVSVIESLPVHEAIKLGLKSRDRWIEKYIQSLENLSKAGIHTVCYNFMPIFDWTRTELQSQMSDGSSTLTYNHRLINKIDPVNDSLDLPGWATAYNQENLKSLIEQYRNISEDQLWENYLYFLKKVIPAAEKYEIKLAVHPDDPPWSIFGIPRIVKDKQDIERIITAVESPNNGITFCTGSLGALPKNDLVAMIKSFGEAGKIHFVHCRNVKVTGNFSFQETAHLSREGDIDMHAIVNTLEIAGFNGPLRPDHGRMIWGETGKPGYGLYDRALGAAYLNGLIEAVKKTNSL